MPEGGFNEAAFAQIVSMHAKALFDFVEDCASDAGKADRFRSSYEELEASVLRASIEDLLRSARASVAQDDFPEDYTHYQVLGIATDADFPAIKAAYHAGARLHHPDRGGSPAKFRRIDEAYKTLGDPERRGQYNSSQGIASPALPATTAAAAGERADHLDDGYSLAWLKEYPLSYEKLSSPGMVRLIESIPRVLTSGSSTTDYSRDFNAELIRKQTPFFSESKLVEFSGALKNFDDLLFLLSQTGVSLRSLLMSQLSEDNLRACLSGSVEGIYLALTDAAPLSVSATSPMVMREAGAVSPGDNLGITTPEQLVAIIKCLGAGVLK